MSKQKKQGFTLIELMVVIVIIGILAAIAIPKLFGMTAKAKASEVGPAAGTWSKLQQAYVVEIGSAGSFVKIGYTPPGELTSQTGAVNKTTASNDFSYSGTPADATDADEGEWKAQLGGSKGTPKLGDCVKDDGVWEVSITISDGQTDKPVAKNAKGDCAALTPNFTGLQ